MINDVGVLKMTDMAEKACELFVFSGQSGGFIFGANWLTLSVLALFVSLFMLVLVYMLAIILSNKPLLIWTKFEIFQVFATAAILVFFLFLLMGICTFDISFLDPSRYPPLGPSGATNMYKIIDNYFDKMENLGFFIYGFIMYFTKIFSFLSKVTMLSSPLGIGSNESPMESVTQVNSLVFLSLAGFLTSFMMLQFQMRILDYMAFASLGFLFPFGIFFRCFEPTREFGGTLIGIAISFFLFYPIIMVFNDFIMFQNIQSSIDESKNAIAHAENQITNQNVPDYKNIGPGKLEIFNPTNPKGITNFSSNIVTGFVFFIKPIVVFFIGAVVLPMINFLVLVEITRSITRFLGNEIDVSNLTRMI